MQKYSRDFRVQGYWVWESA